MRYITRHCRWFVTIAALMALGGCASAPTFKSNAPAPAVNTARTPVVVGDIDPLVQQEYDNALTLMSVEDYDGAAQILQPFVARHAEFPAAATLLAVALRKTDRVQAAFDIAQQTVALYPDYAPALNEVGILHRERGEFEQSEAAYLKAVTVRPDYALAHFNFGILLDLYMGRPEQALTHYEQYQALTPGEDKLVNRWIADISRRIQRAAQAGQ